MGSQCPGRAYPAYHTRLDHGAAGAIVEEPRCGKARRPAATERAASLGSAAWETACFLSGFEGLREKGFCLGRASRADAAWTDAEIVVAAHSARRKVSKTEKEQWSIANDKLRCIFAMFGACLNLLTFPNRPTGRTLRLLSCPPRLLVPRAKLASRQALRSRGDLRQNAVRVIAVDHPIAPARTRRLVADSLRKSRREFCEAPHCLRAKRAFAIAIVTRRAETPVGWLGEERSDE